MVSANPVFNVIFFYVLDYYNSNELFDTFSDFSDNQFFSESTGICNIHIVLEFKVKSHDFSSSQTLQVHLWTHIVLVKLLTLLLWQTLAKWMLVVCQIFVYSHSYPISSIDESTSIDAAMVFQYSFLNISNHILNSDTI